MFLSIFVFFRYFLMHFDLGGTGEWYWFRRPGNPPFVYALTNECATGGDFQYLFQLDH